MLETIGAILVIVGIFLLLWDKNNYPAPWMVGFGMVFLLLGSVITPAHSQHEHHSAAGRFYKTWMMPDLPTVSCCNENDCYATEARKVGNRWEAKRREDGKWLSVPDEKIERNRDNPDGQNHLCAPPPMMGDKVYCFSLGVAG